MKERKDWYIGTDYYVDYKEKRIQVQQLVVEEPVEQQLHEQAEMYYIWRAAARPGSTGPAFLWAGAAFSACTCTIFTASAAPVRP